MPVPVRPSPARPRGGATHARVQGHDLCDLGATRVDPGHTNAHSPLKSPNWALEISVVVGVAHEHRGQIIARFQCLLTESLVAKRLGQSRPDSKDALYQMLFEELEQRGLKGTPEYRNVMFRADQHAEWPRRIGEAQPLSNRAHGTLTAPEKAA